MLDAGQVAVLEPELQQLEGVLQGFCELGSADADGLDEAAERVLDQQRELFRQRLGVSLDFLDLLQQALVVRQGEEVPGFGVLLVVLDAVSKEAEDQVEAFVSLFRQLLGEPGAELAAVLRPQRAVDLHFFEEALVAVVDLLFVEVVLLEEPLEVEEVVLGRVRVLLVVAQLELGELQLDIFADIVAQVEVALRDRQPGVLYVHVEHVDFLEEQAPHREDFSPHGRALLDRVQSV